MDDEIERIQETLEDMKLQRDQLLIQHIDQYRALTSPIWRLS